MKLTFLGTSHGVPAADRYCSTTMLETGGSTYFVDAGSPLIDILIRRGVDMSTIRAIFATHTHGDHVNGILPFADLANWYFKDIDCDIYLPEQLAIDRFLDLIRAVEGGDFDDERLRFKLMDGGVYSDQNIKVTPYPTKHLLDAGRPAFSYLIEGEGKRVVFSGDLSQNLKYADFPSVALESECDLLICEMAHFGVDQVLPFLEKCRARRVLFNHVYPWDKLDKINALNGKFGYPIATVNDDDVIEL